MPSNQGNNMSPCTTQLGQHIREQRLAKSMSQRQLAEKIGSSQRYISDIETGKIKSITVLYLPKFSSVFECSIQDLRAKMMKKHPPTEFGRFIMNRCNELGLSFDALAKKMNVALKKVEALVFRKHSHMTLSLMCVLPIALDLETNVFLKFIKGERRQTNNHFGLLIQDKRQNLGMTLSDLARKLNVTRQRMQQIECGAISASRSREMIEKLANALSLQVDELLKSLVGDDESYETFGKFVRQKRKILGLSQQEVADKVGVSSNSVSLVERGRKKPQPSFFKKFSSELKCNIPSNLCIIDNDQPVRGRKIIPRETSLGKFLTERRVQLNLSQQEIAILAQTRSTVITSIERGRYRLVRNSKMLKKLEKALNVEIPNELLFKPRKPGPKSG